MGEKMSNLNPYGWSGGLRALLMVSILTGGSLGALVGMQAGEMAELYTTPWSEITGTIQDFEWSQLRGVRRAVDLERVSGRNGIEALGRMR